MALSIEDYALIGDCHGAGLVGRDGSIDWLCLPRFDSPACFAKLLGDEDNGYWLLAPAGPADQVTRKYRQGTLVLETTFSTSSGTVRLIDFMPLADDRWDVVRIVEGVDGCVDMRMQLAVRFEYGSIVPWVHRRDDVLNFTAGPDTLELRSSIQTHGEGLTTAARFEIVAGARATFVLNYRPSHLPSPPALDAMQALGSTVCHWEEWSGRCTYEGRWRELVLRSVITLKALIYKPTGGIVAAPTTSLPEKIGGVRNWDYRFCWLRDSTFTLNALVSAGYAEEGVAWREWLLRAVAGVPADMQILYGIAGERRCEEVEVGWLPGFEGSAPVRTGNAAIRQFQLDVYGEVMDTLHVARASGQAVEPHAWRLQVALLDFLEHHWQEPDEGIWEVRGSRRHFTHSKVMAWVAFDRAVKAVERLGLEGPVDLWRATRDRIHAEVCRKGFSEASQCFVQHYETQDLDASLLLMPLVGFLPADDPRVVSTVEAIMARLTWQGFVLRYATQSDVDDLPPGEGIFLPCSLWLVDCLVLLERRDEAEALFERIAALCNDVGLLSEEYDPSDRTMLGNFPQALSHMALVNTAVWLSMPTEHVRAIASRGERLASVRAGQ